MLVIVSNGQTESDREKIFMGQNDSPLTNEGLRQINDASDTLSDYKFDTVYSSDLFRAQITVDKIHNRNKHGFNVEYSEELRERSYGSLEGQVMNDIRKKMSPRRYRLWDRDPFDAPEHGESCMDILTRLEPWFEEVKDKLHKGDNVLVISHPDTIRCLVSLTIGVDIIQTISKDIEFGMPYFYYGLPK